VDFSGCCKDGPRLRIRKDVKIYQVPQPGMRGKTNEPPARPVLIPTFPISTRNL
jgi:hypothetical protein